MRSLTEIVVSPIRRPVGRTRINAPEGDKLTARFPEGTLDRLERVLRDKEPKSAFIRDLVLAEIERREAEAQKD